MSHNETECQPEECQFCPALRDCVAPQAAYVRLYAGYNGVLAGNGVVSRGDPHIEAFMRRCSPGPAEALVMAVLDIESPQEWLDRIGRACA